MLSDASIPYVIEWSYDFMWIFKIYKLKHLVYADFQTHTVQQCAQPNYTAVTSIQTHINMLLAAVCHYIFGDVNNFVENRRIILV